MNVWLPICLFLAGLLAGPFIRKFSGQVVLSRIDRPPKMASIMQFVTIDLALGAVFALLGVTFQASFFLVPYLLFATVLVLLSAIDIETHLLPNNVVWPSIWLSLVVILSHGLITSSLRTSYAALLGGLVFSGFFAVAFLVYPKGMGLGDVKLALLLGFFLGWPQESYLDTIRLVLYAALIALLLGGVIGLAYTRLKKTGSNEIPFGPFLCFGTICMVLGGETVLSLTNSTLS